MRKKKSSSVLELRLFYFIGLITVTIAILSSNIMMGNMIASIIWGFALMLMGTIVWGRGD